MPTKVLVATPYRAETDPRLVARTKELYESLAFPDKAHALYENGYGYSWDYRSNARARNELLDQYLTPDVTHILWVDVDITDYPPDLIEQLLTFGERNGAQVVAPRVMLRVPREQAHPVGPWPAEVTWYDIGGFVQDGQWVSQSLPYFDLNRELDSVGTCYLIPADVFRSGARYGSEWGPKVRHTEHWKVMQAARQMGMHIRCDPDVTVWHAYLPAYGMHWQAAPVNSPRVKIRCIEGCAGLWGSLEAGQVVELDGNIAESLLRGGLVVEAEPKPEPPVQKQQRPRSKRASAS